MIEIRPLHTLNDIAPIENLQRAIWQMTDDELLCSRTLHAFVHSGGRVLGAFAAEKMIGFAVCILGRMEAKAPQQPPRLRLYSMIAGVLAGYRDHNVGARLKLAQRDFALEIGVPVITWTYDPLESRNGRFNISKLGAVCRRYYPNYHGSMTGINAGLPTDRFMPEWWVAAERVQQRLDGRYQMQTLAEWGDGLVLNTATFNPRQLPVPPDSFAMPQTAQALVEVPHGFQALKQQDMPLAQAWRQHTRDLFQALFAAGYTITDFTLNDAQSRSFYVASQE